MKNEITFTVKEFADMHHINKRTLHYYDEIGLFSPAVKNENNYRYYTLSQSAELEYILSLKELGMSISEIKEYLKQPNSNHLIEITNNKIEELDRKLHYFMSLKKHLNKEKKLLDLSFKVKDQDIVLKELPREFLFCTPISHNNNDIKNIEIVMKHLRSVWDLTSFKVGCGSYISLDKVLDNNFYEYDGLFSIVDSDICNKNISVREKGFYLCGYNIGSWEKIPHLYQKMVQYAKDKNLVLVGNAYEIGLNNFSNLSSNQYITEIIIKCQYN